MSNKQIIVALIIIVILASVSLVAANQTGIITINIFNRPSTQLYTDISNSTIRGQTNYTNSQAVENITLTNSTLTLNINGQNITITDQGDNVTITPNQTPNPTPTSIPTANPTPTAAPNPTATPKPLLTVTYLTSRPNPGVMVSGKATMYDFSVNVEVPTSLNYPFGEKVTDEKLGHALIPLIDKYTLATNNYNGFTTATWQDIPIVDGKNTFSLFSTTPLTQDQIQSLTSDLYDVFSTII